MKRTIQQYLEEEYAEGSRPCYKTILNRIKSGALNGKKEGGTWYILDAPKFSKNPRVNEILQRRYATT